LSIAWVCRCRHPGKTDGQLFKSIKCEAVNQVGGNIQSSQVDVQGNQARDGLVSLLISCEVDQPALQKLLYDLEAGMPFLYVDQLDVQMPQAAAANEAVSGRLRVILGVSGQWRRG
jgi:general secretion pathway protein M